VSRVRRLICPVCEDAVQKATPLDLGVREPDPGYRHIRDKSALCRSPGGRGRAEPVAV